LEKRRRVRIFRHIRNMNKLININKKINNMNTELVVKYTFGTMAATLLVMNIAAFGVIIVNGIISLI
jgi:hypothetical protein